MTASGPQEDPSRKQVAVLLGDPLCDGGSFVTIDLFGEARGQDEGCERDARGGQAFTCPYVLNLETGEGRTDLGAMAAGHLQ